MFKLFSSRHVCVPWRYTNMAAPFNVKSLVGVLLFTPYSRSILERFSIKRGDVIPLRTFLKLLVIIVRDHKKVCTRSAKQEQDSLHIRISVRVILPGHISVFFLDYYPLRDLRNDKKKMYIQRRVIIPQGQHPVSFAFQN